MTKVFTSLIINIILCYSAISQNYIPHNYTTHINYIINKTFEGNARIPKCCLQYWICEKKFLKTHLYITRSNFCHYLGKCVICHKQILLKAQQFSIPTFIVVPFQVPEKLWFLIWTVTQVLFIAIRSCNIPYHFITPLFWVSYIE